MIFHIWFENVKHVPPNEGGRTIIFQWWGCLVVHATDIALMQIAAYFTEPFWYSA